MKKLSLIAWLLVMLLAIPSWALAISVYYMPGGDPAQDTAINNALNPYAVTTGVQSEAFDGNQSLSGYNVVLLSASSNWLDVMSDAGQTALKTFVEGGGGLITGEWVLWMDSWPILNAVFPGQCDGYYSDTSPSTYTQDKANSVLNYLVTSSFTFPVKNYDGGTESNIMAKDGATIYYTSDIPDGGAGLVGWSYGAGRVLNFSTCISPDALSDADYKQLLVNSVYWAAGNNSPVPIPGSVLLLGSGLLSLLGWRRLRKS